MKFYCNACERTHLTGIRFFNQTTGEVICHKRHDKKMIYIEYLGLFVKREEVQKYFETEDCTLLWAAFDNTEDNLLRMYYQVGRQLFEFYSDARAYARATRASEIKRLLLKWQDI